jgi:hypothetical protein
MADKEYKDLTPKERYDSALKADKEPWNPLAAAKEMIKEKMAPKKDLKKGALEGMKYGPGLSKEVSKFDENYKKGGKVKKYCRGGGIEVRGKTKGRMV